MLSHERRASMSNSLVASSFLSIRAYQHSSQESIGHLFLRQK
nr:MAG TPA: hypothetical protein [Caudoviricetes sp.]